MAEHVDALEQVEDLCVYQTQMPLLFHLDEDPEEEQGMHKGVFGVFDAPCKLVRDAVGAAEDDGGRVACLRVEDGGDGEVAGVGALCSAAVIFAIGVVRFELGTLRRGIDHINSHITFSGPVRGIVSLKKAKSDLLMTRAVSPWNENKLTTCSNSSRVNGRLRSAKGL